MSKKRWRARTLVAAVSVMAMLGLAASAQAVTITSAGPTTGLADGDPVNVQLSFGMTEVKYAIAQCNDDLADGLACNNATAIGQVLVSNYPVGGHFLTVNSPFTNGSLIPKVPPISGTTTCKGKTGSNCAVFVTTYDSSGKFVDSKQFGILFS